MVSKRDILKVYDLKTFERGSRYYEHGRVVYVVKCKDKLLGEVIGNERYYVEVDLSDLTGICSCPIRYNCKHAVAVILSYLNGEFVENNSKLAEAYPITAVKDVEDVVKKLLKYLNEKSVLDIVRLLRFHGEKLDKDFLIEILEGLDAINFYNDYYDYYFHETLVEAIVRVLVEKGLSDAELKKLKEIVKEKEIIGKDLAWYLAHHYDEFLEFLDPKLVFRIYLKKDRKKAYEFALKQGLTSELVVYFNDLKHAHFSKDLSYEACRFLFEKNYNLRDLFDYCFKREFYDICIDIAIKLDDLEMMKKICETDCREKIPLLSNTKRHELVPYMIETVLKLVEKANRDSYRSAVRVLKNLKNLDEKSWLNTIEILKQNHSRKFALWEEIRSVFGNV